MSCRSSPSSRSANLNGRVAGVGMVSRQLPPSLLRSAFRWRDRPDGRHLPTRRRQPRYLADEPVIRSTQTRNWEVRDSAIKWLALRQQRHSSTPPTRIRSSPPPALPVHRQARTVVRMKDPRLLSRSRSCRFTVRSPASQLTAERSMALWCGRQSGFHPCAGCSSQGPLNRSPATSNLSGRPNRLLHLRRP